MRPKYGGGADNFGGPGGMGGGMNGNKMGPPMGGGMGRNPMGGAPNNQMSMNNPTVANSNSLSNLVQRIQLAVYAGFLNPQVRMKWVQGPLWNLELTNGFFYRFSTDLCPMPIWRSSPSC